MINTGLQHEAAAGPVAVPAVIPSNDPRDDPFSEYAQMVRDQTKADLQNITGRMFEVSLCTCTIPSNWSPPLAVDSIINAH